MSILFKAVVMCSDCGEIHGEKWLESRNRHATQTVLEMLCASCEENDRNARDFNPFANPHKYDDETLCTECDHPHGAHYGNCTQFDPMESAEYYHNGGGTPMWIEEDDNE